LKGICILQQYLRISKLTGLHVVHLPEARKRCVVSIANSEGFWKHLLTCCLQVYYMKKLCGLLQCF